MQMNSRSSGFIREREEEGACASVSYCSRRLNYMHINAEHHDDSRQDANDDDHGGEGKRDQYSAIPPETPEEPLEFLSRSWSLSANEISKALSAANKKQLHHHPHALTANHVVLSPIPDKSLLKPRHLTGKVVKPPVNGKTRAGAIGRLFHHKAECSDHDMMIFGSIRGVRKNKDRARIDNAHTHAVLSVAGLAAALSGAVAAAASTESSKINMAMASATKLLATYCIELAESSGADCQSVASVVGSARGGILGASDLLTLTAAAATALRGEAALRARLPCREARRSAAISPYGSGRCATLPLGSHVPPAAFHSDEVQEEEDPPCAGDLLHLTQKGELRWKHVSVYISKSCQVTIKLKSKHIGRAFSKNNKSTVYDVIDDESGRWPFQKERENMQVYFGVKSGWGLLEFKCKNPVHKQKWVQGIQKLLHSTSTYSRFEVFRGRPEVLPAKNSC